MASIKNMYINQAIRETNITMSHLLCGKSWP